MNPLAIKCASFFVPIKRRNETIITMRDALSDEEPLFTALKDLVNCIHNDHFYNAWPNDWIYEVISSAFDELSENAVDNIAIEADIYYHQLAKWFSDNQSYASSFCDEALEEGFCDASKGIHSIIACGQWLARERIYRAVNDFLEEQQTQVEHQDD